MTLLRGDFFECSRAKWRADRVIVILQFLSRFAKLRAMKTVSENLLQEITRRLVAEFAPDKVILFGSHAWGNPNEDSDVDLMVIVPESNERPAKRASRAYFCLRGMGVPKDILVYTRMEVERQRLVYASLICEALERGRTLYG